MSEIPFRQVHLDFHTSEHITQIGAKFDPNVFADTLANAHVNAINCFGRGHHGWLYYYSERFPERQHPHLTRNLLKEQIEACHQRGIRVPIYITVQWDFLTARQHPEWLVLDADGRPVGTKLFEAGFYNRLALNSPYLDFLKAQVEDVFQTLPVDGMWFDIIGAIPDASMWTRREMEAAGLDPADPVARQAYARVTVDNFRREMTAFVRQFSTDCSIFYNEGHIGPETRSSLESFSHLEIESLPSGGWGYTHFPITGRYTRTLGIEFLGMTGKFHTTWGDFHSFKNKAALEYECFQMLALGAKCSIGDQLHPHGEICQTTYKLIGSVYESVEAKEPWCTGAQPIAEIAVMLPDIPGEQERITPQAVGALRMLQEAGHQFDFIDLHSDLSGYKVLVLPDIITLDADQAARIAAYVEAGGAVIATYESGLDQEKSDFLLDGLGVHYQGESPYSPNFVLPGEGFLTGLAATEHVMYSGGTAITAENGVEVLADVVQPFFNRTYQHFTSHQHTPSAGEKDYPAAVRYGQYIYFTHPLFTVYAQKGPHWCKQLFLNALALLLPEPLLRHNGPTSLLAAINAQPAHDDRWVVHLLHYIPERRSQEIDIIEDVIPLYDLEIRLKTPRPVRSVMGVPQGDALDYAQDGDGITVSLPKLHGHQMIAIEFE